LIRWIASTRLRLFVATCISAALLLFIGPLVADFVWNESASHSLNLLCLLGFAFVLIGFGASSATLVGDMAFPNRWRERVLLGRRVPPPSEELDSIENIRGLRTYLFPYSALIALSMIAGGFAFEQLSDGFLTRYQRFGGLRTTLRSDDDAGKIESLRKLAGERRENRIRPVMEVLDLTWRDPRQSDAVRTAALEVMGALVSYLSNAIDSWSAEGRSESWQRDLFAELRQSLGPDLLAAREHAPADRRADLLYLSGLLRDNGSEAGLIEAVGVRSDIGTPLWRASVIALGRMRTFSAYEAVIPLGEETLSDTDYGAVAWVTQTLAREFHKGRPDLEESRLTDREREALARAVEVWSPHLLTGDESRRCIATTVALYMRDARMRDPLIAAFDSPGAHAILCPSAPIDVGLGKNEYVAERGFFQRRIIDALALIALGDATLKTWVNGRLKDMDALDPSVQAMLQDLRRYL